MKRLYEEVVKEHFAKYRQMIFLTGPRQVGKTTTSKEACEKQPICVYFNWDDKDQRKIILEGPKKVASEANLDKLSHDIPWIIFDEIHKYDEWKDFLKGFFDTYSDRAKIIVTGSAKLDFFKASGDSLMGRYFSYRIHPLSVREITSPDLINTEIKDQPKEISEEDWNTLLNYGGFPEPFILREKNFYERWKNLRFQQLFQEDLRDLTQIHDVKQMEVLTLLLKDQSGQLVNYSNLSKKIGVSAETVKRWIDVLKGLYFCFTIQPWFKNVSRSLIKEPKVYLWDWSLHADIGKKTENLVASHLLKAANFWTDYGFGNFELYFLRDKDKKEVDFLITKNEKPFILVEVKNSHKGLSPNLFHFQKQLNSQFVFQISFQDPYVQKNCFYSDQPIIVPAKTFLSQLV